MPNFGIGVTVLMIFLPLKKKRLNITFKNCIWFKHAMWPYNPCQNIYQHCVKFFNHIYTICLFKISLYMVAYHFNTFCLDLSYNPNFYLGKLFFIWQWDPSTYSFHWDPFQWYIYIYTFDSIQSEDMFSLLKPHLK